MARRRSEPAPPPAPAPEPELPPLSESALAAAERLNVTDPPLDREFDPADLAALRAHGRIVRLGPTMHIHTDALAAVRERVVGG